MLRNSTAPPRQRRRLAARDSRKIDVDRARQAKLAETVGLIVAKHSDPGRILELYYWSRNATLLPAIRALMQLPQAARATLLSCLATAPQSLHASGKGNGRLPPSSSHLNGAVRAKARANGNGARHSGWEARTPHA